MDLVYPNEIKLFRIALVLAVLFWLVVIVGTVGIALIYLALFFLFALFVQAGFITYVKGSGVLITPEQYPDIHARLLASCEKVGVQDVPDTYLLRTDFFNALATRFLRRHYIVLFTDVVDALEAQPEALNFYIGHELGHIHRQHIRWGWILGPVLLLPILGSAYRRAEEYTCDRYGNACCPTEEDAVAALAAIVAGDTRWKTINVPEYLKQVDGTGGFWMSLNEFTSDYPWLSKRMAWVLAMRRSETPSFPRRHPLAAFLSAFVPSVPGGFAALLFTVILIGVLAAVALPAYQAYQQRTAEALAAAQGADAGAPSANAVGSDATTMPEQATLQLVLSELAPVREAVAEHHSQQGSMPTAISQLGWDQDVLYSEHGGMPIQLYGEGIVLVGLGESDDGSIYFVNEPFIAEDGTVQWYCYGQNVPTASLPHVCQ
ncbi:MAG: M48 family metallopeptidase [Pseudomonadota bacterium]